MEDVQIHIDTHFHIFTISWPLISHGTTTSLVESLPRFWSLLLNTINPHIHHLIIKCNITPDLGYRREWGMIPPHYVSEQCRRGQTNGIILRCTL